MPNLTDLARDDRSARQLLSFVAMPNDEATGRLLDRLGAEDVIALADSDRSIPGMDRAEAAVWRDRIHARHRVDQLSAILTESGGFRFLIPSDPEWPISLQCLGDRAPYGLWVNGNTDLLRSDSSARVTITGARAATGYGAFIAEEISSDLAGDGRKVGAVPGPVTSATSCEHNIVAVFMMTVGSAFRMMWSAPPGLARHSTCSQSETTRVGSPEE